MQVTEINTLERLTVKSLRQHVEMVELLKSLPQQLETHSFTYIKQFNATFGEMQKTARQTDRELLDQLNHTNAPDSIRQLLDQRKALQEDILQLLKQSIPKANSVKSLLASEMQSVKNGRTALSGYKNQYAHQGRIVNEAS